MRVGQVFSHVLRQQMAPVAGGVNQNIGRGRRHRAIKYRLERFVTGFALVKAQVIAKNQKLFAALRDDIHDVRQVHQVFLVDLNQPQALRRIGIQTRPHQRRLSGAARPGQQHVVGRLPAHKLCGIAGNFLFLDVNFQQIVQAHRAHLPHRNQIPLARHPLAVQKRDGTVPVGLLNILAQGGLHPLHELHSARQKWGEVFSFHGLKTDSRR